MRWDIDGRSQRAGVADLQLEAEEGGLEPPPEGRRVFQRLSFSSSSDAFDEEESSSSMPVILMMMPMKVRVISRGFLPVQAGRGVLHNHSAQMQSGRSHQQK